MLNVVTVINTFEYKYQSTCEIYDSSGRHEETYDCKDTLEDIRVDSGEGYYLITTRSTDKDTMRVIKPTPKKCYIFKCDEGKNDGDIENDEDVEIVGNVEIDKNYTPTHLNKESRLKPIFEFETCRYRCNFIPMFFKVDNSLYLFNHDKNGEYEILNMSGSQVAKTGVLCISMMPLDVKMSHDNSKIVLDAWLWHPVFFKANIDVRNAIETGNFNLDDMIYSDEEESDEDESENSGDDNVENNNEDDEKHENNDESYKNKNNDENDENDKKSGE